MLAHHQTPVRPIAVRISRAATMLDCSRQHVYDLIAKGSLRRVQIEGSTAVRVPVEDIYSVLGLEAPTDGATS
jgi:excisionase family DNA binding protein